MALLVELHGLTGAFLISLLQQTLTVIFMSMKSDLTMVQLIQPHQLMPSYSLAL